MSQSNKHPGSQQWHIGARPPLGTSSLYVHPTLHHITRTLLTLILTPSMVGCGINHKKINLSEHTPQQVLTYQWFTQSFAHWSGSVWSISQCSVNQSINQQSIHPTINQETMRQSIKHPISQQWQTGAHHSLAHHNCTCTQPCTISHVLCSPWHLPHQWLGVASVISKWTCKPGFAGSPFYMCFGIVISVGK